MNLIYIDFPRGASQPIPQIVVQGEYGAHAVRWDLAQEGFYEQWPGGHGTIWFAKADSTPWPLSTEQDGTTITGTLSSTETAETGLVKVCLVWANGDAVLAKTKWYWMEIGETAYGGADPDETASDWLAQIASIQDAAETAAEDAEAWAVGTRGGTDVGSDDDTYHNNAKYYATNAATSAGTATTKAGEAAASAEAAAGSATSASGSASTASTKATAASSSATAASSSASTASTKAGEATLSATAAANSATAAANSATAAANSAEAAAASATAASTAQGKAEDAQAAAEAAQAAAEDADDDAVAAAATATEKAGAAEENALDAEAWAIGTRGGDDVDSDDETYHNNAKYYADSVSQNTDVAAESASSASDSANAAAGSEQNAEAWAVGKREGEDVGSTDPTYHNNSKYYAGQAASSASSAAAAQSAAESAASAAGTAAGTYSALLASIAGTFSAEASYAPGDYVWYSGSLYRFDAPHEGAWTGNDTAQIALADAMTLLWGTFIKPIAVDMDWDTSGGINSSTGYNSGTNSGIRLRSNNYTHAPMGAVVTIPEGMRGYLFLYSENKPASFIRSIGWRTDYLIVPAGLYFRLVIAFADDAEIDADDVADMTVAVWGMTDYYATRDDTVLGTTLSLGRLANVSVGTNSTALGRNVWAGGDYSVAIGDTNGATGVDSFASGTLTAASGEQAHTEGKSTVASGNRAHAEGMSATASGTNAHAEGQGTTASGANSHAEGYGAKAAGANQHAGGKYNVEDDDDTYAEIIGNGTGNNARSNARTLDWDGNERLAGDVYVGCNDDSTGGTKLIKDVQVDGTSVASNGAANIPMAAVGTKGAVKLAQYCGLQINNGNLTTEPATSSQIKAPTTGDASTYRPITPRMQDQSVFYGLAKAAGDVSQAGSDDPVGTYTGGAKAAIQDMLGIADIVANDESTMEASRAYVVGEYILIAGSLYRVTQPIAQGGTIYGGENCVETSLADELGAVKSLDSTPLLRGAQLIDAVGIPTYVDTADLSNYSYSVFGLTEPGWYVFAQLNAPRDVTVSANTSITGAAGSIATNGNAYVQVAVKFDVAAISKKVTVNWDTNKAIDYIFRAQDLATRNLDYRSTFYVYDIGPYATWSYKLSPDATFNASKKYFTKSGSTYTEQTVTANDPVPAVYYELNDGTYSITEDETFDGEKTYYTPATPGGTDYAEATVTAGDTVPPVYYVHDKVTFAGMTRNVTYRFDEIVDGGIEFILPEIDSDDHGAWIEVQLRNSIAASATLTPPDNTVKFATAGGSASITSGLNVVDLHYTNVAGQKMWTLINVHTNIPA